MRLLLMKMCAIAVVNLVAGGAEGRNVIRKSDRTLQLKRDAEHLRTYQSTSDGEEERGFDFAIFEQAMENFHREVSANPESLDYTLQTLLKSETFTGFFKESYNHGMSPEEVFRALEFHANKVPGKAQYRYKDFMKKQKENIYSTLHHTLAESVHPTAAESVHPTVADPVSTRSKDKGPAEIVGGQLSSKVSSDQDQYSVWLQNGVPPIKILKLLELDEVGDTFLEDVHMLQWTSYVTKYNHKYSEQSTTVFDVLKEMKIGEETIANMVFSWASRKTIVIAKVRMMFLSVDKTVKLIQLLRSYQDIARVDILNGLKKSWAFRELPPTEVLDILGLQSNLQTGLDVARLVVWFEYMESRRVSMNGVDQQGILQIGPHLKEKGYKSEQLKNLYLILLENKYEGPLITKLREWIELEDQAQMMEPLKRKRDTS